MDDHDYEICENFFEGCHNPKMRGTSILAEVKFYDTELEPGWTRYIHGRRTYESRFRYSSPMIALELRDFSKWPGMIEPNKIYETIHYGWFENEPAGSHAEDPFCKWIESTFEEKRWPNKPLQVDLYTTYSPCKDCGRKLLDLKNRYGFELTIFYAFLYEIQNDNNRKMLIHMAKSGVNLKEISTDLYDRLIDAHHGDQHLGEYDAVFDDQWDICKIYKPFSQWTFADDARERRKIVYPYHPYKDFKTELDTLCK